MTVHFLGDKETHLKANQRIATRVMQHLGMMGHGMMGHSMAMRIIFSLMDADGDGKLTLQEWQTAHERIFREMDTDHDGTVTLEEMEAFMHGH
jgi:Ca2+-binding EF-hand superfamily protein